MTRCKKVTLAWTGTCLLLGEIAISGVVGAVDFDDVYSAYKKTYQDDKKVGANGSYYAVYASMAAQVAIKNNLDGTVIANQGVSKNSQGDVTIGGITVQPGGEVNAQTIIIQNTIGPTIVSNRRP